MTTIYVDLLFCTNLIINYFLILVTARINRIPVHRFRYILGAAVGAIFSLFIFFPVNTFISIIIKCIFSLIIVLVSFGRHDKKTFFKILSTFFAVTFSLCGLFLGFWFIFKPENMAISNGIIYFDISPTTMILMTVGFYVLFGIINRITKSQARPESYCRCEIVTELGSILLKGIVDSGNTLCDLFTDSPVVVVDYNSIMPIIPAESRNAFKNAGIDFPESLTEDLSAGYRVIPYNSVKGTGLLPAFKPKGFYIYNKNKSIRVKDVLVAVSENLNSEEKAIINPRVFELWETEGLKCLKK